MQKKQPCNFWTKRRVTAYEILLWRGGGGGISLVLQATLNPIWWAWYLSHLMPLPDQDTDCVDNLLGASGKAQEGKGEEGMFGGRPCTCVRCVAGCVADEKPSI